MNRPLGLRAGAVGVGEAHLMPVDHGPLEHVEVRRRLRSVGAPRRRVEDDRGRCRLRGRAERFRERRDQLAEGGLGVGSERGGRAGEQEQSPGLVGGEPAEVGAGAADQ